MHRLYTIVRSPACASAASPARPPAYMRKLRLHCDSAQRCAGRRQVGSRHISLRTRASRAGALCRHPCGVAGSVLSLPLGRLADTRRPPPAPTQHFEGTDERGVRTVGGAASQPTAPPVQASSIQPRERRARALHLKYCLFVFVCCIVTYESRVKDRRNQCMETYGTYLPDLTRFTVSLRVSRSELSPLDPRREGDHE